MKIFSCLILLFTWYAHGSAGTDSVYVQFVSDTVKIWNVNASENCCIRVVTSATVSNDSILVIEHDTSTAYCYCECTFDFSVSLTGLHAGSYFVRVYRQYTMFTPDSLYFIDTTTFSWSGGVSGNLKYAGYQSPCHSIESVRDKAKRYPARTTISQNYPNPFNPTTEIRYQIPEAGWVTLKVFDLLGREVATLVNETKQPGEYTVTWDAEGVPSGVYYYRMTAGSFVETKKLILLK